MNDNRKKRHPIMTILILLSWFLIFLPSIKLFFGNILFPSFEFRQFKETENDLSTLIQLENALFPNDFISKLSKWESYDTNWSSNWHIYRPYLEISIFELENLDSNTITAPTPSEKKSAKRKISNADFWAGVYNIIISNNKERLNNLASSFIWFQEKNELSDRETLVITVSFAQKAFLTEELSQSFLFL